MSYSITVYYDDSTIEKTAFYNSYAGMTIAGDYGDEAYSGSGFDGTTRFTATPADGCEFSHWVYRVSGGSQQTSTDNPFIYEDGEAIKIRAVGIGETSESYTLDVHVYITGDPYGDPHDTYSKDVGNSFDISDVAIIPSGYTFRYAMVNGQQFDSIDDTVNISDDTLMEIYCIAGTTEDTKYNLTDKGTWSTSTTSKTVSIGSYEILQYSYTPTASGTLTWYSNSEDVDTIGWINDESTWSVDEDGVPIDDSYHGSYEDDTSGFSASANVEANKTYYLFVCVYSGGEGSDTLYVTFVPSGTTGSGPTIYDGDEYRTTIAYVYDGTSWQATIPYIYDGNNWVPSS